MRRALPTAVLLLLALTGVAHADFPWLANNRAAGFQLDGLHAPQTSKDPSTAALRLGDVAVCAGIPWSIGVNGAFRCSADGTDFLSPATGLLLGGHAGFSVIGRSAAGTGAAADIIPSGTPPIVLTWDGSSTSFKPVTPASSGGIATWSLTGVRVFAVNPSGGSDANQCWADSADATQANVAAATVTAWAKACATLGGASAELPPQLAGRKAYVVAEGNGTTYTDPWTVFDRQGGMVFVFSTGTNSTCGATAGTGTTADLICQGAQTTTGMNVAGYHPVSNATSNVVQLVKVGGGSPAFPAEVVKPLFVRFRGDVGNATTATQNHVNSVVAVTAADTIQLNAAIAYTTADTFYLEDPGATAPGGTFSGNATLVFAGVQASSIVTLSGQTQVAFSFSQFQGSVRTALPGGVTFFVTSMSIAPFSTVGPSRMASIQAGGSTQFGQAAGLVVGNFNANEPPEMEFDDYNVIGGNAILSGGAMEIGLNPQFGGSTASAATSCRVLGKLTLNGVRINLGFINLPSTSQTVAVTIIGTNDILFGGNISGGLKTNVGMDLSNSTNSRFTYASTLDDGTFGLTVTGANGDMYYGTATNIGLAPIYQSYTGFSQAVSGTVELSTGDRWTNKSSIGAKLFGTTLAVAGYNSSGVDIPSARLIRFGVIGDARDIAIAQADTFANAVGAIGMSLGVIKNGQAGWVATTGNVQVGWSDVAGFFPGAAGWPAYLSDTVAGFVTHDPPSGGTTVVRQICWSSSENECLLAPDNWTIGGGLEIGGSVSPGGPPNIAVGGILQRSAMTMSGAVVGTFSAGSNTAATTFGAAPALSGLFNTTNASAVPTWLACTGAGQVIQDTGTAMACAALTLGMEAAPTGSGFSHVTSGAWDGAARAVDVSGADITNQLKAASFPALTGPVTTPGGSLATSLNLGAGGISGTLLAAQEPAHTGDVTNSAGSLAMAFRSFAATSVLGRAAGTSGIPTEISSSANNQVLQQASGALSFAQLNYTQLGGSVPAITSLTTDVVASGTGAVAATIQPNVVGYSKIQTVGAVSLIGNPTGSTANASEITLGTHCAFTGSVLDCSGGGGSGITALTGDVTASGTGSVAATVVNLPNGVTQAGLLNITETAAPATPAAGHVDFFADSTQHNGAFKNSSGTLTYGAQVDSGASHHFLQTFAATGAFTDAQPAFTDISGQATLAQSPSILSDSFLMNATGSSAVPSAVSPGTTSGIMEYVHGSPDTLTAFASGSQRIPFGSGTSGQFTDSASFTYDGSEEIIGTAGTQSVNFPFFGTLSAGTSIKFNTSINQGIVKTAGSSLYIGTAAGGADIVYFTNGVGVMDIDATQRFNWGGSVEHAAGLTMQEWINTPPSTASAASLGPVHDFRPITITLTGTTHNTSAKGHVYFEAPTITDASAVTVDDFPTVGISGGPIAAGSVTLTLAPALEIFSGAIQIDALSAGGMLKTNTHGDIVLATSGTDYQAPIGWPTATDIVISPGGTGSTNPAFDSNFTYNTTTHTLTSAGTNVLGSSTGIAYLTAGTLGTATLANYDSAEQTYYMEITTGSIVTINAGSQYIATNSSNALFGTSQIEYPTAGALPSFLKVSVCIVGTNTISTGGLDIFHSINGAGGVDATLSSSSSGCTSNASTNFGGTAADKFGIGLQADAGLGGGSVTLSGTLHLTIKIREAPVSTF